MFTSYFASELIVSTVSVDVKQPPYPSLRFSTSLICLAVSVDVKHHVYLLCGVLGCLPVLINECSLISSGGVVAQWTERRVRRATDAG